MSLDRFAELALPYVEKAGVPYGTLDALRPALAIVKPKVKHLSDVPDWIGYLFTEDFEYDEAAVKKALGKPDATTHLATLRAAYSTVDDWTHENLEAILKSTAEAAGAKTGAFIHPARVAASGRAVGPGLYEMLEVLGKDRTLARIDRAIHHVSHHGGASSET